MDYGKLAYLKTEELENAIKTNKRSVVRNSNASFASDFPLRYGNDYKLALISGSGKVSVILKIYAQTENGGKVELRADGKTVSFAHFNVGLEEHVMICSLTAEKGVELSLSTPDTFRGKIKSTEFLLIGENAVVKRYSSIWSFDCNGDKAVILKSVNERIILSEAFVEDGRICCNDYVIGYGSAADVFLEDNKYYVIYSDNQNNMWGLVFTDGVETYRTRLAEGADSIAIAKYGSGGIIVAFTRDGKVHHFTTSRIFSENTPITTEDTIMQADSVRFMKNSSSPVLIIMSQGRSFIKTAEPECFSHGAVNLSVTTLLEGVNV